MQNEPRNERFTPEAIDEQIAQLKQGSQSDAAEARLVKNLERTYREEQEEEQAIERIHARLMAKMQATGEPSMRQPGDELLRRKRIDNMHIYKKRQNKQQWMQKWNVLAAAVVMAIVVGSLITVLQITHRSSSSSSSGGTMPVGTSKQQTSAKTAPATDPGIYLGLFNQLVKVDEQTHKVLWRFVVKTNAKDKPAFPSPLIEDAPIVANGMVYFTAQTDRVYAVDAQTGQLRWESNFHAQLWPLRIVDNILYVNTEWDEQNNPTNLIYALDPVSGTAKTKYQATGQIAGIFDGVMYLNNDATLTAVKVSDGSRIWATSIDTKEKQNFNLNVYLKNGKLYAYSTGKPAYAYMIDPKNGKITWTSPMMDGFVSNIAVGDDGRIYCGAQNHYVYAFDPRVKSQKELWKYHTIVGHVYPAPIVQDGIVYVGQSSAGEQHEDDHLVALDAATGQQKWATSLKGYTGADNEPLVLHNGVIYLGTAGGLQGFAADSGKQVMMIPNDLLVSKKDAVGVFMGIAITIVD